MSCRSGDSVVDWVAQPFPDSFISAISCCELPVQVLIVGLLRSPVSDPRRARAAAVSLLPDLRPRQPGNVCQLRPVPCRQRPDSRRSALPGPPAGQDDGLLDLRTLSSHRDLQDHRRAIVPRLPEAASALRRLRQRPADPRRDAHQPALPGLRPAGPFLLARPSGDAASTPSTAHGGARAAAAPG